MSGEIFSNFSELDKVQEKLPIKDTYKVLARKYRPNKFSEIIGQDIAVKILSNAITLGRASHAFLLTGIRGVGKTTIARILAKALNCINLLKNENNISDPCGSCENCLAINEGKHQDIIEMDAASHTGVNDIREIIENVKYKPFSAKYKIYIIDEVHMLSISAFNAILKTLEEPPPYVKFIFATTELQKIPLTILSRCQKFYLKRVNVSILSNYLSKISIIEGIEFDKKAISLISQAADGSVRDALSILDQAIVSSYNNQADIISEKDIISMLGMADMNKISALFKSLIVGEIKISLEIANEIYHDGADPIAIIQNLMQLTHFITKMKSIKEDIQSNDLINEASIYQETLIFAKNLSLSSISRLWQIMLKGYHEIKESIDHLISLEMILIRIAYDSKLPPLESFFNMNLSEDENQESSINEEITEINNLNFVHKESKFKKKLINDTKDLKENNNFLKIETFQDLIELIQEQEEVLLHYHLFHNIKISSFKKGEILLQLLSSAPKDLPTQIREFLQKATGDNWIIKIVQSAIGIMSEYERSKHEEMIDKQNIENSSLVQDVINTFHDITVNNIKI